jgi:hypothetical protein
MYDPALHARRIGLEWSPQRYAQLAMRQPRFTPAPPSVWSVPSVPSVPYPRHLARNRAFIGIGTLVFILLILSILRHAPAGPAPSYLNADYLAKAMMRQANGGLGADGGAGLVTAALCNEAQPGDFRCSLVFARGSTASYDVTVSPDGLSYIAMPAHP